MIPGGPIGSAPHDWLGWPVPEGLPANAVPVDMASTRMVAAPIAGSFRNVIGLSFRSGESPRMPPLRSDPSQGPPRPVRRNPCTAEQDTMQAVPAGLVPPRLESVQARSEGRWFSSARHQDAAVQEHRRGDPRRERQAMIRWVRTTRQPSDLAGRFNLLRPLDSASRHAWAGRLALAWPAGWRTRL